MEVILREDVEKLGTRGELVKVASGYARNFLLPKRLAVAATESNKKIVEQERQAHLRREAKVAGEAGDLAKLMTAVVVTISQKAGENGQLFGSVTTKDIADALEAQGYTIERRNIAVDQRLLRAILDRPQQSIPDLVRFASEDHSEDLMDLDPLLIDLFHVLRTPEALPFFVSVIRRNTSDVPDDLVESIVQLGAPALEPLLVLLDELDPDDAGDVPFVIGALRIRDARVLGALTRRLESDPQDAALCLEIHGDPAAIPALEPALAKIPDDDPRSRAPIQAVIETLSAGPKPCPSHTSRST